MSDTNERLTALEQARQTIEDTLVVMAHLENRQSQIVKDHTLFIKEMRESLQEQKERGKETDARIEKLVSAIGAFIAKS